MVYKIKTIKTIIYFLKTFSGNFSGTDPEG